MTTEDRAVSSVGARHVAATEEATRKKTRNSRGVKEKGGNDDEGTFPAADGDEWSCDEDEWVPYDSSRKDDRASHWSDSSSNREKERKAYQKKAARKPATGCKLYAIARGRGGASATGLYRETWDNLDFLVTGFSKARYKRVQLEKEGVAFIKGYYRSKGLGHPHCFKEGRPLYPRISKIR